MALEAAYNDPELEQARALAHQRLDEEINRAVAENRWGWAGVRVRFREGKPQQVHRESEGTDVLGENNHLAH
jgi:hypothetical protein